MNHARIRKAPRRRVVPGLLSLPLAAGAFAAEEATAPPADDRSAEPPAEAAAPEAGGDLRNWVEFGAGGTLFNGDKAAFQQRYGLPDGAFGGIESFHYEQGFGKDGLFKADGRAIFDNHDYAVTLDFTWPEKGYVRGGYREFRTWWDPSGGYFPPTRTWPSIYDDPLHLDQREFFIEAGLRLPKIPELTLRYSHTERDGQKDSTIWGDTSLTGGLGNRSLVPAILDLDRVRDLVMADLKHTVGRTKFGLGLRYDRADNDDARLLRRFPGEGAGTDRHVTQRDRAESELFNVHAHTETRLSNRLLFTAGYSFTDLDTDTSGYRVYGTRFDPDFAQRLGHPNTFESLVGGSLLQQHVGNVNLMVTLADKLVLVPSLRVEGRDVDGTSTFAQPAAPFASTLYEAESQRGLLDVSEALELRYTGVTNWVFYARGYWLQGRGDLQETLHNRDTSAAILARDTDDERTAQKYSAGANWYPLRRLNFGAEYYHKRRDNDYEHSLDSTSNLPGSFSRYPAFLTAQSFDTDDFNFRVTWRPRGNLTLVGRYDFQFSTIDTRADGLAEVQSSEMTSHIASGSLSWVPLARLYLQGSLSYVWDRTETPVSELTRAVADAENDYWTANATVGYALDDRTDLEAQYLFYRADNYTAANAAVGQPFGAGAEDHGVTAGLLRRLSKRVRLSLKYGYFTSHDALSGGNRDYESHLVYSTLQYRF